MEEDREDWNMAKKVYAVRRGRKTGIFHSWADCQAQTTGFSGAQFKSFSSVEEARQYLSGETKAAAANPLQTEAVAYVDGSFQVEIGKFSCGVVLFHKGEEYHFSQSYEDQELALMRNVAGEIKGAETAMQYCLDHQIRSLCIYHDYEGIASWCTGAWKTNKEGTKKYKEFYDMASKSVDIFFVKVKGHSGDKYNDMADQLAKAALCAADLKAGE